MTMMGYWLSRVDLNQGHITFLVVGVSAIMNVQLQILKLLSVPFSAMNAIKMYKKVPITELFSITSKSLSLNAQCNIFSSFFCIKNEKNPHEYNEYEYLMPQISVQQNTLVENNETWQHSTLYQLKASCI